MIIYNNEYIAHTVNKSLLIGKGREGKGILTQKEEDTED